MDRCSFMCGIDSSSREDTLREGDRSGLCPTDRCGDPKVEIADQMMKAATGPPGEVWLERQGKWLSIAAIVWPKFVDRRLEAFRNKVVRTKSVKKRRWRLFQVESALACNLRCIMCPWTDLREKAGKRGVMSPEVWEAIQPYLPEVRSVDFTGGGEPLLQPRLAEWIAEAKSAGCETGVLTNGLLLNKETARELIAAGLDWVCFSIDATTAEQYERIRIGSSFDRVCENLANIVELRKDGIPKTMINFVLMPMNFHQIEDIVRLAARLGVDQVNFKQCEVIRGERGKGYGLFNMEETKEVRRMKKDLMKAVSLAGKLKVRATAFAFTPTELPVCSQDPRDSVFIRYDGVAAPCINYAIGGPTSFIGKDVVMPTEHYGRVTERDLIVLWESEKCKFYRTRFQSRVQEYENIYARSLFGDAHLSPDRLQEAALRAMPEAPDGCKICHYLYDI